MSVRPLELLDLPLIYRLREDVAGLDTTRVLTRGNPLGAVGLLAHMNPRRHVYAAVADGGDESVLGSVIQTRGEPFAKLLYLAPSRQLRHPELPELIEDLTAEAGAWGAFHLLAECDEDGEAFAALRRAGFSVYAWQRMWDVTQITPVERENEWRRARSVHGPAVQSLYQQIVPPLLHAVEPQPQADSGWIFNEGQRSFVGVKHGVYGIVLTPLIHPEVDEAGSHLAALIHNLPDRRSRPVYLCVRSYQAWLEPVLADLGATGASRQAVMVKHMTRLVKDEQAVKAARPARVSVQPSRVDHGGS